jgi:hypothetical protein
MMHTTGYLRRGLGLAAVLAWAGMVWGCAPPSALELDYGNSVRNNIAQQVVTPKAALKPEPAVGLAPSAGTTEMERYTKTFKGEEKASTLFKISSEK